MEFLYSIDFSHSIFITSIAAVLTKEARDCKSCPSLMHNTEFNVSGESPMLLLPSFSISLNYPDELLKAGSFCIS